MKSEFIRSEKESKPRQSASRTLVINNRMMWISPLYSVICLQRKSNYGIPRIKRPALAQWLSNTLMIKVLTFKRDVTPHRILPSGSSLSFGTCTHIMLVNKFEPQGTGSSVFD